MVGNATDSVPPGEWITGRGWHQDKWALKEDVLVEGDPLDETKGSDDLLEGDDDLLEGDDDLLDGE